jgi:predicted dehydrogenase
MRRSLLRFGIAGLGSMGKRRVRCLQRLGCGKILAYDPRPDRRDEAHGLYGIPTTDDPAALAKGAIDVLIVSTPPDTHVEWARRGLDHGLPTFIEASVVLEGLEAVAERAARDRVVVLPSCTMRFHPAIAAITRLVRGGEFGHPVNFSYHSGQYLPDWHPWERITDFYVSQKSTGAAREIVAFELTWLVDLFGFPVAVTGLHGRQIDLGVDIDDTYVAALEFPEVRGALVVDVVSRHATRRLILNLAEGQLIWDQSERVVRAYSALTRTWRRVRLSRQRAAPGYNVNIGEEMYVHELKAFIGAAQGGSGYPTTLEDDIRVLKTLRAVEASERIAIARTGDGVPS